MGRLLAMTVCLAVAATATAQVGTITDGDALFEYNSSTSTEGSVDFSVDGGVTDNLYQNWWWYRLEEDTAETAFPWAGSTPAGPDAESYVDNVATLTWNASTAAFDAELVLTLEEVAPGQALLTEEMTIYNPPGRVVPIVICLFNYLDADVDGSAGGDSAVMVGPDAMEISDGNTFVYFQGVGANAYQVTSFSSLRGELRDTDVDDLDNSGLPFGPGDFTGAFEWINIEIAPGESFTVVELIGINIPEPASLVLLALGAVALVRRR